MSEVSGSLFLRGTLLPVPQLTLHSENLAVSQFPRMSDKGVELVASQILMCVQITWGSC